MKVLLYTEGLKAIRKSGLGLAIEHQKNALLNNNIDYTTNIKDDFDILHINFYGPKSYLFAKKAKKNGKKIVYHAHSTEEDFKNSFIFSNLTSPLFKKWLIKCYSLGDHIITPTPYSKTLLENYGIKNKISAISNGIDVDFFKHNEDYRKEFRDKYKFNSTDKVIMGVGLYIERKGILDFVELAKRLPEYKFIWFGHSPLIFSPNKIKKAIKTDLPNLIFAGYVSQSEIKKAYSGADLYLFPTLEETEGIPIMEACAAKIPALIRDINVFHPWLINNKNVYMAKNLNEFEIRIKEILSGRLKDLTDAGYEVALSRDIKKVGKQLIEVYEDVLK